MRAITSGSRMIIENSPVGSSKSNGIVERAIQSVQEMIRTIRSDIEGRWKVKIDATHSIWPCVAEQAGFLLTRFEAGRDGKTAYERLEGKSAKVQGLIRTRDLVEKTSRRTAREVDMHVRRRHLSESQSDHRGGHRDEADRCVADENSSNETSQRDMGSKQFGNGRRCPVAQKMKMTRRWNGERLKSEVIVMDKKYKKSWQRRNTFQLRSECTYRVRTWRNLDSQRDVWDARHCIGEQ